MTKWSLFIGIILSCTYQAQASEMNLLSDPQSFYQKLPIYKQGNVGNCYAVAATSFMDFLRLSEGEKLTSLDQMTSLVWTSYIHTKFSGVGRIRRGLNVFYDEDAPLENGTVSGALSVLHSSGICSQKMMQEILFQKYPDLKKIKFTSENLLSVITGLPKRYLSLRKVGMTKAYDEFDRKYYWNASVPAIISRPLYNAKEESVYMAPVTINKTSISTPIPTKVEPQNHGFEPIEYPYSYNTMPSDNTRVDPLNYHDYTYELGSLYALKTLRFALKTKYSIPDRLVSDLLNTLVEEDGYFKFLDRLYTSCLSKTKKIKSHDLDSIFNPTLSDIVKMSSLNLSKKKPLLIEYCSTVISTGKVQSFVRLDKCGAHASIIVGKRNVKGVHQVLLQNSWGQGCDHYKSQVGCMGKQGAVWVNTKDLAASSIYLTWLD